MKTISPKASWGGAGKTAFNRLKAKPLSWGPKWVSQKTSYYP